MTPNRRRVAIGPAFRNRSMGFAQCGQNQTVKTTITTAAATPRSCIPALALARLLTKRREPRASRCGLRWSMHRSALVRTILGSAGPITPARCDQLATRRWTGRRGLVKERDQLVNALPPSVLLDGRKFQDHLAVLGQVPAAPDQGEANSEWARVARVPRLQPPANTRPM